MAGASQRLRSKAIAQTTPSTKTGSTVNGGCTLVCFDHHFQHQRHELCCAAFVIALSVFTVRVAVVGGDDLAPRGSADAYSPTSTVISFLSAKSILPS